MAKRPGTSATRKRPSVHLSAATLKAIERAVEQAVQRAVRKLLDEERMRTDG